MSDNELPTPLQITLNDMVKRSHANLEMIVKAITVVDAMNEQKRNEQKELDIMIEKTQAIFSETVEATKNATSAIAQQQSEVAIAADRLAVVTQSITNQTKDMSDAIANTTKERTRIEESLNKIIPIIENIIANNELLKKEKKEAYDMIETYTQETKEFCQTMTARNAEIARLIKEKSDLVTENDKLTKDNSNLVTENDKLTKVNHELLERAKLYEGITN